MADHARGELLRQLRSERGLSQEAVAQAIGVTAKTYGVAARLDTLPRSMSRAGFHGVPWNDKEPRPR